jgi:phosphate transport system permease protein
MSAAVVGPATSRSRRWRARAFEIYAFGSTWLGVAILVGLLAVIVWQAWGWLNLDFLANFHSRFPRRAGIKAGLWGSLWLMLFTTLFAVPIGIGAAIYLEEYAKGKRLTNFIQLNLSNLAGVPSVVYGILGLTAFVRMFGLFGTEEQIHEIAMGIFTLKIPIPLGRCVLAGAMTLALLVMPMVIVAAQESLRAVPQSLRHASYALGATQWQTIRHQVLPAAMPGILTGIILAVSRAIGETAPLVMIGALTYIALTPGDIESPTHLVTNPQGVLDAPFSQFSALPIQIFNWVSLPQADYQHVAAAGIVVLLAVLLLLNGLAMYLRLRYQKRVRW